MKTPQIKGILTRNQEEIAFFIGNGINLHFNRSVAAWDSLLFDLWGNHSFKTRSAVPDGVTNTEFYDVLGILMAEAGETEKMLQREVQASMKDWKPSPEQNILLENIQKRNLPILTTNFDDLIPKSMGLRFTTLGKKKISDIYPWSGCYTNRLLHSPNDGFAIWYVHGMVRYHRSIKLGLSHYMNNVSYAKQLFPLKWGEKELMDNEGWSGYYTWLNIFFNRSLFFFGLSLEEDEVFLRWLLIQRAKYYRLHPNAKKKGWFLMKRGGDVERDEGKKFFLESVGLEVIVVDGYKEIYEDLWS